MFHLLDSQKQAANGCCEGGSQARSSPNQYTVAVARIRM